VTPQRRLNHADGTYEPPAHARERDLLREPTRELRLATFLDEAALCERLENASMSNAASSRARRLSSIQVVCRSVMLVYPRQGHNH
jgi:hypothetical protein